MATVAAIATQRANATQRIANAAQGIANGLGVEALSLPLFNRDPHKLHAEQLSAIADYLEGIEQAITPEKESVPDGHQRKNKRPAIKTPDGT